MKNLTIRAIDRMIEDLERAERVDDRSEKYKMAAAAYLKIPSDQFETIQTTYWAVVTDALLVVVVLQAQE